MFLGAIPVECLAQAHRVLNFSDWNAIYVCCSGSFRIEQTMFSQCPDVPIFSNDVSLTSCAIGNLAIGKELKIEFIKELAFIEAFLQKNDAGYRERVAAILVALNMSQFGGKKTVFAEKMTRHYQTHFSDMLNKAGEKIDKITQKVSINDFFMGDWREHLKTAISNKAGVFASPPFYKAGYEKLYKFIDDNIIWDSPKYDIYDPSLLHDILLDIENNTDIPYCIISDQYFTDLTPILKLEKGRNVPHYCYGRRGNKSSVRLLSQKVQPFKYTPVNPQNLGPKAKVSVVAATAQQMNFIKNVYLAKGITHSTGMLNFLVFLDGNLIGGFIYDKSKFKQDELYLLSDLCIVSERKLSKFVAMLATSKSFVRIMETKLVVKINSICTTAFSKNPASMKYRGIFELYSRKENEEKNGYILQYVSEVRDMEPQQMWQFFWHKYGKKS